MHYHSTTPGDDQRDPGTSSIEGTDVVTMCPEQLGIGVIFWTMSDAAVVANVTTGKMVFWNPAAEQLFGWSAASAIGSPIENLIPERLRVAHTNGVARYLTTGSGRLIDGRSSVELPALRSDGTEITIELNLTPLADDRTPPSRDRYVLALIRDASDRARLAAEREALLSTAQDYVARLEELATLKAGFTAMVAHELGAPVAAIRAISGLLQRGTIPSAEQTALLSTIRRECDLIGRLVTDVTTAAEVERHDFSIHVRPVAVSILVADALTFIRTLEGDHHVEQDIDPVVLATQVYADPARIGQVIRNLLGNANKHTPPDGLVMLRVRYEGGYIRIEVADDGPGIPDDELEHVFAKYGRGHDAADRKTPGLGLGPFLARQLLRAHGSVLTATSTPGEGTVFSFTLEVMK